MATEKKTKKPKENKREKALRIVLAATQAWDVSPKGTVVSAVVEKLADEIVDLTK